MTSNGKGHNCTVCGSDKAEHRPTFLIEPESGKSWGSDLLCLGCYDLYHSIIWRLEILKDRELSNGKGWKCPNNCDPECDTPFFYAPGCIAHETGRDYELGILAYDDLEPSNRWTDGTVGISEYEKDACRFMDCLPHCVKCLAEVERDK